MTVYELMVILVVYKPSMKIYIDLPVVDSGWTGAAEIKSVECDDDNRLLIKVE